MTTCSFTKELAERTDGGVLGGVQSTRPHRVGAAVCRVTAESGRDAVGGIRRGGKADPNVEHVARIMSMEEWPKGLAKAGAAGVVLQGVHVAAATEQAAPLSLLEAAGGAPAVVEAADQGVVDPRRHQRRQLL